MMNLFAELRFVGRSLRRNSNRTLVAVFTVAGGITAFLLAGGFIHWVFQSMREDTIRAQLGHIQIVRPGYFEGGVADPYSFLLPPRSAELQEVRTAEGVESIAERLAFSGLISRGDATVAFVGEGVDPAPESLISNRLTVNLGRPLKAPDERAVLIGEGLAKTLGVKPGDDVVLLATAANGATNAVELKVAGVFFTATKEYDDQAIRAPIEVVRKLMRVSGATSWVVLLDRTERTPETTRALQATLPAGGFTVVPWSDLADFYNKTVVLFSKQVDLMKTIIGLIIVLTISNTQMMSVLERTTEIGTIMAVGQRRSGVMRLFVIEGVLLGLLGGIVGVTLGWLLATLISAVGIPMPPPPGMARGFVGEILVNFDLARDAMLLALGTTLLASIMPAWKASRMNIVDALRTNQ